jgi:thiol:disulfide interchange protein
MLNDAEEDLKLAETYEARVYTPYEWSEAKVRIQAARSFIEKDKNHDAITAALEAKTRASEALRLSRISVATVSIKKARDSQDSVEENKAFRENEDLYQRMLSDTKNAEKAFIADQIDVSIRFSKSAIAHAGILMEPVKKEAEIIRGRVTSAWREPGNRTKQSRELEALIREGEDAFLARQYMKAVSIWEKADKELRSPKE